MNISVPKIPVSKLPVMIVDTTEPVLGRGEFGKVPDFIQRNFLNKPSIIGGKIRGAIRIAKYGLRYRKYPIIRYNVYRQRKKIVAFGTGTGVVGALSFSPRGSNRFGQTRNNMVKYRSKRKYSTKHKSGTCCPICG